MTKLALTEHARRRVVEFGLGLDVVESIASRPDVTHRNTVGQTVCVADAHPEWTVVLGHDDVVVTVLRRLQSRWEHEPTPARRGPSAATLDHAEDARALDQLPGRVPSRRRSTPTVQASSVVRRSVDPDALRAARELADGDLRRLVLNEDGSVTVLNRARQSRA